MVVIDIDGVLADTTHRAHHLRGRRDWDAFFAAAGDDAPIPSGRAALDAELAQGSVTLLTGRPERLRGLTEAWLDRHGFPAAPIVMRPDRDRRRAAAFKQDALAALGGPSAISLVVDDDPDVVGALHADGYLVHLFDGRDWTTGGPGALGDQCGGA